MPGIFGIISKGDIASESLKSQFARMAGLLNHLDYYEVEKFETGNFIAGRIGIPYRGYKSIRLDNESSRGVIFDGYLYGFDHEPGASNPHLKEPVSVFPLNRSLDLTDIIQSINGSFTIAMFDISQDKILLATDKLGYRNLYYYQDDKVIAFAPEIKAFQGIDSFKPVINPEAVADYFNYHFVMGGRTFYQDVFHCYAATILRIDSRQLHPPLIYWKPEFSEEVDGDADAIMRKMYDLAGDAFQRQMGDHGNFMMALSGGMDSRLTAYFASRSGRKYYYFSHGSGYSVDARIAREVAAKLKVSDDYRHHRGAADCYFKYGDWTAWLVDGMIDISCCFLTSVLDSYNLDPLQFEFQNTIYTGAMNFASAYGKMTDITRDFSFNDKFKRLRTVVDADYKDESYYRIFHRDYGEFFKNSFNPHLEKEFSGHEKAGDYFINQLDSFFLQTRILRLSNQYDLNRFFYHDHFSLIDDPSFILYVKMPMRFKAERMLYKKMFQSLVPEMARIKYQKTGVDLFGTPSPFMMRFREYRNQFRYYVGRLSLGAINLRGFQNYVHPNEWYRSISGNRAYYENILLDQRTLARRYYDENAVRRLLYEQARGANNFYTISGLASFELFNRYFIDMDDPPKFEKQFNK